MLVNNTSTTSKRSLWPEKTHDLWVTMAADSELLLSNGKWYDDWASALGANTLGYNWDADRTHFRPAASLPWAIEELFADEFCEAMGLEAVRFFKSGSDALSCAVRLARGFTKRETIIVFDKSYHGTGDWFGRALWTQGGIPFFSPLVVHEFGGLLDGYSNKFLREVAAIVVEPVPKAIELPPRGWLKHLRKVCDANGILLISDEVILGYRHSLRGYMGSEGQRADLYCYGKAMGQGAAISACAGRAGILGLLKDTVHFSGTNNGAPTDLAVARSVLSRYLDKSVCASLTGMGGNLKARLFNAGFETKGLPTRFEIVGAKDAVEYCFDHGILYPGFCSMALTHTDQQQTKLIGTLSKWRDTRG